METVANYDHNYLRVDFQVKKKRQFGRNRETFRLQVSKCIVSSIANEYEADPSDMETTCFP